MTQVSAVVACGGSARLAPARSCVGRCAGGDRPHRSQNPDEPRRIRRCRAGAGGPAPARPFTGPQRSDLASAFKHGVSNGSSAAKRRGGAGRSLHDATRGKRVAAPRRQQLNFFHASPESSTSTARLDFHSDLNATIGSPFRTRGAQRYVDGGHRPDERAVLVGIRRLTCSPAAARQQTLAASLGLDEMRPTAIFAPTFSPESALNVAGEAIIESLLGSGCNVIAKLHDRSLDPDPRFTGGINWRQRLGEFSGPNFLLASGGDSTPYVLASAVMVTDHSSIGFELCAANRPLIVFDVPELITASRINPQKSRCSVRLQPWSATRRGSARRCARPGGAARRRRTPPCGERSLSIPARHRPGARPVLRPMRCRSFPRWPRHGREAGARR